MARILRDPCHGLVVPHCSFVPFLFCKDSVPDSIPGRRVCVCVCWLSSIDVFEVFVSHHFALELDPVHACEHARLSLRARKWGTWRTLNPEDQA